MAAMQRDFGRGRRFTVKDVINYKDVGLLQKCCSPQGKLYDSTRLNTTPKQQRDLAKAVKRARFLALLRYTGSGR